ncbi:MAG: holo-ACP synthase [Candidatus Omnitrophica bacterium]|nr:holo-ACP synthase [Candidatus Omnitrophota bacterium]
MILGHGTDIVEVERISRAIKRWGDDFLKHVFTDQEIAYAKKRRYPEQHLAARFAAKEAVLKALGENAHVGWKDIEIINQHNGKPSCIFHIKEFNKKIFVSLSHTKNYAVANAIITM